MVYNVGSGSTHVLDPVAALLVKEVLDHSSETDALIDRVAKRLAVEMTEELHNTLLTTLHTLDRLGLIEAASH